METATLGDFSTRLDLVTAFLAEVTLKGNFLFGYTIICSFFYFLCFSHFAGGSSAGRCLGNVVMYYRQFSEKVEQSIQQLIAPVEKEFNVRNLLLCCCSFVKLLTCCCSV